MTNDFNNEKKIGVLRSWNERKGFGIIFEQTSVAPVQRYWLHVSNIAAGLAHPPIGAIVHFEIAPYPPKKLGYLPSALNAVVLPAEVR
ncbi:MAG: hypothetical protein ABSG69_19650 [Candidatus Acidiferrum sp.]|jgi:cold shock CspA family protein